MTATEGLVRRHGPLDTLDARREIDAIIEANAARLGEDVTIGVHVLRDGRVRIFDFATGWRTRPYREYADLAQAHVAAIEAERRAIVVENLRRLGMPTESAVRTVTQPNRFVA